MKPSTEEANIFLRRVLFVLLAVFFTISLSVTFLWLGMKLEISPVSSFANLHPYCQHHRGFVRKDGAFVLCRDGARVLWHGAVAPWVQFGADAPTRIMVGFLIFVAIMVVLGVVLWVLSWLLVVLDRRKLVLEWRKAAHVIASKRD
jgi:hypothetical protein